MVYVYNARAGSSSVCLLAFPWSKTEYGAQQLFNKLVETLLTFSFSYRVVNWRHTLGF